MKKNFFDKQISNKLKSIQSLPDWLANFPEFRDQIKLIRETLGMTQEQLAKKVQKTLQSIHNIESGRALPKISTLFDIADALNANLKIVLIPRQNIMEFLDEKAQMKAEELVKQIKTSSVLEIQPPSDEVSKEQIENLKREILEKRRSSLWNQNQITK